MTRVDINLDIMYLRNSAYRLSRVAATTRALSAADMASTQTRRLEWDGVHYTVHLIFIEDIVKVVPLGNL